MKEEEEAAALLIQKHYRGYRTRREISGLNLSKRAERDWNETLERLQLRRCTSDQLDETVNHDSGRRWKRGKVLVGQLIKSGDRHVDEGELEVEAEGGVGDGGDGVKGGASLKKRGGRDEEEAESHLVGNVPGGNRGNKVDNVRSIAKHNQRGLRMIERWTRGEKAQELSKVMESSYWLEMVDTKHRYGSNLKHYHKAWNESETTENFFKWLDHGEGKNLDLDPVCSRERLEKERITYLSAEQRSNYVVDVVKGKLVWRRNGKWVDTAKGKHRDLGQGRGIEEVAEDGKREEGDGGGPDPGDPCSSSSESSTSSDQDSIGAAAARPQAGYGGGKGGKGLLSSSGWTDRLLRKTVKANTWIYVLNAKYELYVGIKETGKFQHSSFLYGGRVLSAGLLKVDKGTLTSLSPLSGHYRAGTAHFRHFVNLLEDSGVDLQKVKLSKSLLVLLGLEEYAKVRKGFKRLGLGGGGGKER